MESVRTKLIGFNGNDPTRVVIDDRGPRDYDSRKHLFLWFCEVTLEIKSEESVTMILAGDIPVSEGVKEILPNLKSYGSRMGATLDLTPKNFRVLEKLAAAFETIVSGGGPYKTRSYKYVCPRTASTLRKACDELRSVWDRLPNISS